METKTKLTDRKCESCEGKMKPFSHEESAEYLKETPGWALSVDDKTISRQYVMKNFLAAVRFIEKIAQIAEEENHHPDIHLTGYRNLRIDLSTHAIGGLSENDFILAAKINELPVELKAT
jgi:4a-hydroxytetrahydrobiopterin dehydratase